MQDSKLKCLQNKLRKEAFKLRENSIWNVMMISTRRQVIRGRTIKQWRGFWLLSKTKIKTSPLRLLMGASSASRRAQTGTELLENTNTENRFTPFLNAAPRL